MSTRLKRALEEKELLIGMQIFTANPTAVEIMGYAGFDWVSIDMEHSATSFESVEHMIRAADAGRIIPLVRVAQNDPQTISHALDAGAAGIIVPHVNTAEDVARALSACRYPPAGMRGVCQGVRGAGWGFQFRSWDKVYKVLNEEVVVVPMIEERQAVENFDAMLQIEGVDVYFIGMADLGPSYGWPGATFEDPRMREIAINLAKKARAAGKAMMAPVAPNLDREYCEYLVGLGIRLLSYGTDVLLFAKECREGATAVADIRSAFASRRNDLAVAGKSAAQRG
jgi:2-keto-3-deoxy-L-rhamnonate aldolase RhmA